MQRGSAVVVLLSAAVLFVVVVELTEVVVLEAVAVVVLVSDTAVVLTVVVVDTVVVTQAGWSLLSAVPCPGTLWLQEHFRVVGEQLLQLTSFAAHVSSRFRVDVPPHPVASVQPVH